MVWLVRRGRVRIIKWSVWSRNCRVAWLMSFLEGILMLVWPGIGFSFFGGGGGSVIGLIFNIWIRCCKGVIGFRWMGGIV